MAIPRSTLATRLRLGPPDLELHLGLDLQLGHNPHLVLLLGEVPDLDHPPRERQSEKIRAQNSYKREILVNTTVLVC